MDIDQLLKLVHTGDLNPEEAKVHMKELLKAKEPDGTADMGFARLDVHRERRTGFPEVIFGQGKTPEQLRAIFVKLMEHVDRVLATRVNQEQAELVLQEVPAARYDPVSRTISWRQKPFVPSKNGYVAVACAGTSDLPVAEEAAITAEMLGSRVERIYDVGVAGIHRLFERISVLREADAIVVAAGMEGALASVVGGLVSKPIIAVPTSIGYGASLNGIAAMLAMLNSCAPGVTVVNIDNGFGAGYAAGVIQQNLEKKAKSPL